jgi:glucose/arabinose dehydrogenase
MRPTLLPLLMGCVMLAACGPQAVATAPPAAPASATPTATDTAGPPAATAIPTETLVPTAEPSPTADLAANVADLPDPAGYEWQEMVTGLAQPVDIESAADGSGRLFVIEKAGRILILDKGKVVKKPFLDIQSRVVSFASEQGLLGLAFDPGYTQNGYFYVNYIDSGGSTVIARYQVSADDPDVADPVSEVILLQQEQPFLNHNGGAVTFGPDGFLYLGLGDGGDAGDPFGNGQSTETLLGKILRIDVAGGSPYAIPSDNPFAGGGGKPEIWSYGLRNPWRIAFDRLTGDLYIGDVGQSAWEEIDFTPAGTPGGLNFGWNIMEASQFYAGGRTDGITLPVAEYSHSEGGCSVNGGEVYRGSALPEWSGVYIYGDYCSGKIWGLLHTASGWKNQLLFSSGYRITTFGADEAGELYLANYDNGGIYQLVQK